MGKFVSNVVGSLTGANAARDAANQAAAQQREAAQTAAYNAAFRPVGMTTRFGSSQFTREIDPRTGLPYISAAGYQAAPEISALQNRLFGGLGGGLDFATAAQSQLAPLSAGAAGLFGLASQLTPTAIDRTASPEAQALAQRYQEAALGLAPTSFVSQATPEAQALSQRLSSLSAQVTPTAYDPTAEAQRIVAQQQGLLAPERESQLAGIRNRLFQTGRSGLGVGGTRAGGRGAANPEMQAYYNALAQQDAAIAAGATQQARANLAADIGLGTQLGQQSLATQTSSQQLAEQNLLNRLGLSLGYGTQGLGTTTGAEQLARQNLAQDIAQSAGLFGTAGTLLGQQAQLGAAAYSPFTTQLGVLSQLEQMAQQPYQLGLALGQAQMPGQTAGSQMFQSGMNAAAQTQAQGAAQAAAINSAFLSNLLGSAAGGMAGGGGGGSLSRLPNFPGINFGY